MTCSHGSGHKMIAQTLKDKYEEYGCEVLIFDIFNEYNRFFNLIMEKLYLLSYKSILDKIYGYLYYSFEESNSPLFDKLFYGIFKDIVLNIIHGFNPDLIVNTYNHRTVAINKDFFPNIPLVNIVTEFTLPHFWIHDNIDRYYLASNDTKKELKKFNVPDEKILISGIPVRKNFFKKLNKDLLKEKYHMDKDKPILVIFAGTFGVLKDLTKICNLIDNIPDLQTIVICGLNKKLFKKLEKKNYKNIKLMRYVNDIQEIYEIGDLMLTKPGGTVLSEIVQKHIPSILYNPTPGQEKENAQVFVNNGAAIVAYNPEDVNFFVKRLINDNNLRDQIDRNLKKLNFGDSSKIIVEDSLNFLTNWQTNLKQEN